MEVHFDRFKFKICKPVVTIGTFDGVHKGHQLVIKQLKEQAAYVSGESVVITFDPHPRHIIHSDENKTLLINTLSEKIYRFEQLDIDHLLIISFTKDFANLSYSNFFEGILIKELSIHSILVGYDHRFGKDREGQYNLLLDLCNKYGVSIMHTKQLRVSDNKVSSSVIRRLLQRGDVEQATVLLSYHYTLIGKVIPGDKIGRKLGFPTANIAKNNPYKLAPSTGVYGVHVYYNSKRYFGMMNIGNRPSVTSRNEKKIEVHIFDFNKYIYREDLIISFIKRIRDEQKFGSLEELKQQLQKDKKHIYDLLKTNS